MDLDIYRAVKQDIDGLKDLGNLRHEKPLKPDDKRDFLLRAYQKSLEQTILLRAALAQRGGE